MQLTVAELGEIMVLMIAGIFIVLCALGLYFITRSNTSSQRRHPQGYRRDKGYAPNQRPQRHQDGNPWA